MTSPTTDSGILAARRRARADLAHGDQRAGARSHFRAMGIDPDRLEHPIVGVASMWTHTMPCNLNHRDLAAAVEQGVTAAGRRRAGVQHDRGLRQPVPGHAGDARVARLARADRGLDRADGHRARLRHAGLHRRLRQDRARRADGAGADRQARGRGLQRPDARGPLARRAGDDPGGVGGRRRAPAGQARAGGARRAGAQRLPRPWHLRRALHRQHDGPRARGPRARRRRHDDGRRRRARAARRARRRGRSSGRAPRGGRPLGPQLPGRAGRC